MAWLSRQLGKNPTWSFNSKPYTEAGTRGQHDRQVARVNEADGRTPESVPRTSDFFQENCQKSGMSRETFVLSFQY